MGEWIVQRKDQNMHAHKRILYLILHQHSITRTFSMTSTSQIDKEKQQQI